MSTVSVNPPKTPVTEGSNGVATATLPNICKMPGPPAPFVPTPLPNIGRSSLSPKDYSKTVEIEGNKVAIQGATFKSMGDVASQGTGGGIVSSNCEGPTSFVGPGSMDVKIEGKNVQLLSDPMLNNNGPSGSPANAATMMGVINPVGEVVAVEAGECPVCHKGHGELKENEATKADAGTLAKSFKAQIALATVAGATKDPPVKVTANTMLGVVYCKCKRKYADQSAMTTVELCNAAAASGMKHPAGITVSYADGRGPLDASYLDSLDKVKQGISGLLGGSDLFLKTWAEASERAAFSDQNRGSPAAYPPGTCAAQKTLLLLLDDGGLVDAMTEEWFSSHGSKTQAPIKFIDNRKGLREEKVEQFKGGQTVPPCRACELIVPLLLCDGEKKECAHKT